MEKAKVRKYGSCWLAGAGLGVYRTHRLFYFWDHAMEWALSYQAAVLDYLMDRTPYQA